MESQEVATCCRIAWALSSGGDRGPGLSQVKLDTLFVRDFDFMMDLAKDLAKGIGEINAEFHRIRQDNKNSAEENVEKRRARSAAVSVASDVVDVMRHLKNSHEARWQYFEKMIKKQTLRQIVRSSRGGDGLIIAGSIGWCADYISGAIGEERLEVLLTMRTIMA